MNATYVCIWHCIESRYRIGLVQALRRDTLKTSSIYQLLNRNTTLRYHFREQNPLPEENHRRTLSHGLGKSKNLEKKSNKIYSIVVTLVLESESVFISSYNIPPFKT